jgi:glycerophosphoryl diester phosphodiesterase
MRWAAARDYRVHVWTVDDPAEARRLLQLCVHAVITNRPATLRAALY